MTHFLCENKAQVTISDHNSAFKLSTYLKQIEHLDIKKDLGNHSLDIFLQQDLIILSPGVPRHLKIIKEVKSHGIKVTGELEFASQFIQEPIIAITGTNGKTTVSYMSWLMLKKSGLNPWIGGNLEKPLSQYLLERKKQVADVLVLEVSSFQLEHIETFNPSTIVLTNLAENHMDRYLSFEEYVDAKKMLFKNCNVTSKTIFNAKDTISRNLAQNISKKNIKPYFFSTDDSLPDNKQSPYNIQGIFFSKNKFFLQTQKKSTCFEISKLKLKGLHSLENIMAAILAAHFHKASDLSIQKVLNSFEGIPHRLEFVANISNVNFYNDSKSTNAHSLGKALDAFDKNIILIMGGKLTGIDYTFLKEKIRQKVKALILVGESKDKMYTDVGKMSETFLITSFEEGIKLAFEKSQAHDTVLLSPGASSFDEFNNYIERGNCFKNIVNQIERQHTC